MRFKAIRRILMRPTDQLQSASHCFRSVLLTHNQLSEDESTPLEYAVDAESFVKIAKGRFRKTKS